MFNFVALVTTGLQGHCPLVISVAPFPGLPVGYQARSLSWFLLVAELVLGSQCHNLAFAAGGAAATGWRRARAGAGALYPAHSSAPFQYIFRGAHLLSLPLSLPPPCTLTRELSYSKAQNARSAINLYSSVSYGCSSRAAATTTI